MEKEIWPTITVVLMKALNAAHCVLAFYAACDMIYQGRGGRIPVEEPT